MVTWFRLFIFLSFCFQNRIKSNMAVEGGSKCVKYLLFFFNLIFWVSKRQSFHISASMCLTC